MKDLVEIKLGFNVENFITFHITLCFDGIKTYRCMYQLPNTELVIRRGKYFVRKDVFTRYSPIWKESLD